MNNEESDLQCTGFMSDSERKDSLGKAVYSSPIIIFWMISKQTMEKEKNYVLQELINLPYVKLSKSIRKLWCAQRESKVCENCCK